MGGRRGRKRRRRQGAGEGRGWPHGLPGQLPAEASRSRDGSLPRTRPPLLGNCLPAQRNPELPTQGQHLTARAGPWGWIQLNDNPARGPAGVRKITGVYDSPGP